MVVTEFKYLGRVLTASDDNWPAVMDKMRKSRKCWMKMSRILGREGVYPGLLGNVQGSGTSNTIIWSRFVGDVTLNC